MSLPNALTVSRLVLTPVFIGFFVAGQTGVAALVFVLASITDFLDGHIARRRGIESDFGRIADPIADKALTGSALVGLSVAGTLAWWVTVVILGREVLITAVRLAVLRQAVIPASRGGKVKTVSQIVAITLVMLGWGPVALRDAMVWLAVGLTLATGLDYVLRAWRLAFVPE